MNRHDDGPYSTRPHDPAHRRRVQGMPGPIAMSAQPGAFWSKAYE